MRQSISSSLALFAISTLHGLVHAQTTPASQEVTVFKEQGKLIRAPQAIGQLGADLFGDRINYYNGSLEFLQTDVSLPGNNSLPVAIARRLQVGNVNLGNNEFMHWQLDIPRIHGTFSNQYGWTGLDGNGNATPLRCSNFGKSHNIVSIYNDFLWFEYWHGSFLYVPGAGEQEILKRNPLYNNIPADGQATPLITKANWVIRCLPALASTNSATPANESGEGFLAIGPDGTQYRFDWLVTRAAPTISKTSNAQANPNLAGEIVAPDGSKDNILPEGVPAPGQRVGKGTLPADEEGQTGTANGNFTITRQEVEILPTLVTDRFGNFVRYNYDPFNKRRLSSVVASDGRSLTLGYVPDTDFISSVSDGIRTWTYAYGPAQSGRSVLATVTLPDQTSWQLAGLEGPLETEYRSGLLQMQLAYPGSIDDTPPTDCFQEPTNVGGPTAIGSMVHPSGAIGQFIMQPTRHGRNGVPKGCYNNGTNVGGAYYPAWTDSYSLTEKKPLRPRLAPDDLAQ